MTTEGTPQRMPKDIVKPDDLSTWELAWTEGVTPWDFGDVQPSLKEALESSGLDLPHKGQALVPGCGAGYDLPYISKTLGLDTLGLEVAETAIARATAVIQTAKAQFPNISASITIVDFFKFDVSDEERFDLIYDHTFFVAIPPSFRQEWGKQMTKLIKPGGYLITGIFPLRPYDETGPPYYVEPEHYVPLLEPNFTKVLDRIPAVSSPSHLGKERIVVWRKRQCLNMEA
ncbi:S-adenosyl-L-methionine-dependent methyltransferase [Pholiota molesta]|nr:S-adenosyl-L-methionine-dependent methyltransferase [Pholiota molesta]